MKANPEPRQGQATESLNTQPILQQQVAKHLAGQFEWLMSIPVAARSTNSGDSQEEGVATVPNESSVYGCNLLPATRRRSSALTSSDQNQPSTNTFFVLATPLKETDQSTAKMYTPRSDGGAATMTMTEPPPPPYTPLKVPEVVTNIERAVSPALSFTSDRSGLALDRSPRPSLLSLPRIEDSLEELDRLEDDLEAIHQVAYTHRVASVPDKQLSKETPVTPSATTTSTASKRASFAGYSSTVRVKPSAKARPTLRRSSSVTLRDKTTTQPQPDIAKPENSLSRSQAAINRLSTPKHPAKSTKPVTVPNFELPGEAVARRLKEQREARLAQQAEGQKAKVSTPPRPRLSKPLPKPTFELPGEAISRRKREEREARLRAEEEEQKKRREFKARPIRNSMGPTTMPRETLASRARQDRVLSGEKQNDGAAAQRKRMSLGPNALGSSISSLGDKLSLPRGRNSMIVRTSEGSRTTSVSTGSNSGKRSSVSAEELVMQKQRGKDIVVKDRSYVEDRERSKRDRELAAKTARDQAAERSRIASREWAEKKRRKELAAKQTMQNEGQSQTPQVTA